VEGERGIGWAAHYAIGVAFAGLLHGVAGAAWFREPTLGIVASRTPRPNAARVQSLVTHAIFGLGLYAAGLFSSLIAPWVRRVVGRVTA
jgi:hypothetical protein